MVSRMNPECKIEPHLDDIKSLQYGPSYFKQFDMVLNALDNVSARRHVNRICLASNIPLIESGTEGWLGQVQPFVAGLSACYECTPQKPTTHYPICTIRANPTKSIHTIVWSKELFERLFGKSKSGDEIVKELEENTPGDGDDQIPVLDEKEIQALENEKKKSITHFIFHKLFYTDILQLRELKSYWEKTKPPTPINLESLMAIEESDLSDENIFDDQRIWSETKSGQVFMQTCSKLLDLSKVEPQSWDKDNPLHLDFVTSASNLRSSQFNIPRQSRFTVKSDAGNIIPAIATTNAIIAGLIVAEAIKVASGQKETCKQTFMRKMPVRKKLLVSCSMDEKNPSCYVCSSNFVKLKVDTKTVTLKSFIELVLRSQLNMLQPTLIVDNDILFESGEDVEEDFVDQLPKSLNAIRIIDNTVLQVEDFSQDISIQIAVEHKERDFFENPDRPFEFSGEVSITVTNKSIENTIEQGRDEEESDDLMIVDTKSNSDDIQIIETPKGKEKKRKREEDYADYSSKAQKIDTN